MSNKTTNNTTYLQNLIEGIKPYRKKLALGFIASALMNAFAVMSPMLLRSGVNALQEGAPVGWLYTFSGLIVLIAVIGGVFRYQMRMIIIGTSRWAESDLREKYFGHLLELASSFFDRNLTGDLMARATDDIERIRMVYGPVLMMVMATSLTLIFSAIMMFILDVKLAILVMFMAPLVGAVVLLVASKLHRVNLCQQEAYGKLESNVQENLTGIRVVKSFVREAYESKKFTEICQLYFKRSIDVIKIQSIFMPVIGLLIGLGIALILWVGGKDVATGAITLGDFIAFTSYLSLMTWPMISIGWLTHLYQRGSASHRRLEQIFEVKEQFEKDTPPFDSPPEQGGMTSDFYSKPVGQEEINGKQGLECHVRTHDTTSPSITFRNIHFSYNDDSPEVLKGINLDIPSGSKLAIVGKTGSGKSTLLRLLSRLYEPQSGEILLNETPPLITPYSVRGEGQANNPLPSEEGKQRSSSPPAEQGEIKGGGISWKKIPIHQLRRMIGYVEQTPFLFSTSIRENIAFGAMEATDEAIATATQIASFDRDIADLPDKYETIIGERGVTLSGGQQQRLTIARALLTDTQILLLDDALSAVDTGTETGIINNLTTQTSQKTVLIVTHRLAAAERADKIAVLDNGIIAEYGNHQELMDLNGLYAAMYRRQRLSDELGAIS
ncbi:ABC transporter ATP-binding protein/permease [bacterium]|nr:ABC transporter ATP-binding protein/permease [bacterium]